MRRKPQAGLTLLEVLVAITLLSLLSVGMLFAMRIGLMAYSKADAKLMFNRRVAGAQRIIQQELEGLMPVIVPCTGKPELRSTQFAFFQAEQRVMRLASTFSLQQGWRGQAQVLELAVIPGEDGRGVRLVVNETPYNPVVAGQVCMDVKPDPITGVPGVIFKPVQQGSQSFVLADQLAFCRFSYLVAPKVNDQGMVVNPQQEDSQQPGVPGADRKRLPRWQSNGTGTGWPLAIRIEMAPLEPDPSRLQPLTVTAPIFIHRDVEIEYVDQ